MLWIIGIAALALVVIEARAWRELIEVLDEIRKELADIERGVYRHNNREDASRVEVTS